MHPNATTTTLLTLILLHLGTWACQEPRPVHPEDPSAIANATEAAPTTLHTNPSPHSRRNLSLPRAPGTIRIAVVSDLNASYGSLSYGEDVHRAVDRLIELDPDLVLSTGDMVAGQAPGLDYHGMWRAFHHSVTDRLASAGIPLAVSPGNHDASAFPHYANERQHYQSAWRDRRPDLHIIGDAYPFQYAFLFRGILFVSLDLTLPWHLPVEQLTWLDQTLQAHAEVPVKIVFGHLPLYPVARYKEAEVVGDPRLEDLLQRHRVTLYLSGHHHAYYPARRGELRLVAVGCLGNGVRPLISGHPSQRSFVLIEATPQNILSVEALVAPHFSHVIDRATLPSSIGYGPFRLDRDDVGAPRFLLNALENQAYQQARPPSLAAANRVDALPPLLPLESLTPGPTQSSDHRRTLTYATHMGLLMVRLGTSSNEQSP